MSPVHVLAESAGQVEPLTVARLLTGWTVDPVMAALVLAVAATYLYGVRVLRRRGDTWPWPRTLCFVGLGLGSVVVATQSALAAYGSYLQKLPAFPAGARPVVGDKWPRDGLYLPDLETFRKAVEAENSARTLNGLFATADAKAKPGGP